MSHSSCSCVRSYVRGTMIGCTRDSEVGPVAPFCIAGDWRTSLVARERVGAMPFNERIALLHRFTDAPLRIASIMRDQAQQNFNSNKLKDGMDTNLLYFSYCTFTPRMHRCIFCGCGICSRK